MIVMEYFEGETLEQMIRQGNLPDEDLLMQWAVELCSVMRCIFTTVKTDVSFTVT